jgi:putative thioredoxin
MPQSPWVIDATEADFQEQVVERSKQVPVVIDFWAPWCGPCRALGPVLEKLADESAGGFVLAKVNVDENPNLAGEFGVSGIPAVFAVRDAAVIDGFAGLMPEEQLREFLARLTPTEMDALAAQGLAKEGDDVRGAEEAYRAALAAEASHEAARVGLARVLLVGEGREEEATELLRGIDVGPHAEEAERLRRVLALRGGRHDDSALAEATAASRSADTATAHLRLGQVLAARGEYEPALRALLAAAERDKKLAANEVRELMVAIFHVVGVRSELADEYRDKLRALLY